MSQNVDLHEIDKFSKLASDWWDLEGSSKPLHMINPVRMRYILQHIPTLSDLLCLDIGCGGGILSESLAQHGANVTGIDLSSAALGVAKAHAEQHHLTINYQLSSAEDYSKQHNEQFDVITCMEMLEHVPNPQSVISAASTMLKPGGWLFLSTINRTLKSKLMMIYGAEYVTRMVPKGTHQYENFIKPAELMRMISLAGLSTYDCRGMSYQVINRNFNLTDNLDINYLIVAKKS